MYIVKGFFRFLTVRKFSDLQGTISALQTGVNSRRNIFLKSLFQSRKNFTKEKWGDFYSLTLCRENFLKRGVYIWPSKPDMYPESWTHWKLNLCTDGCFPVSHRGHPFCFSLNSFVVVIIYVFLYSCSKAIERRIVFFTAVKHFIFEPSKERLHNAVIVAITFPRHRLDNSVFL